MKIFGLGFKHAFLYLCAVNTANTAIACNLPAGQPLWIRLTNPISTFTAKPGDAVHAILTQDVSCDNNVVLRMGSAVEGKVVKKRKVGWGIWHETATLQLQFKSVSTTPEDSVYLTAYVEGVGNAREVVRKGVIQGIRSSATFQGTVNSRLIHLPTWDPYTDIVLVIFKAAFPIFPEPEIYFPIGTDMRLRTTSNILVNEPEESLLDTPLEDTQDSQVDTEKQQQMVSQMPLRVVTKKGSDADLINLVFVGSQHEITSAFRRAGWQNADHLSKHTVLKNFYALLNNSGYSHGPMKTFFVGGQPQDMSWQKSLNTYDLRDHLRIWRWNPKESKPGSSEDNVWISSSTHDTGAVLNMRYMDFRHHISPDIDEERSEVIRDLNFAGCLNSVSYVDRPSLPVVTYNSTGDQMHTDGAVAILKLQPCDGSRLAMTSDTDEVSYKPGNKGFRFVRRQILTIKNDLFRANMIYGIFALAQMGVKKIYRAN